MYYTPVYSYRMTQLAKFINIPALPVQGDSDEPSDQGLFQNTDHCDWS